MKYKKFIKTLRIVLLFIMSIVLSSCGKSDNNNGKYNNSTNSQNEINDESGELDETGLNDENAIWNPENSQSNKRYEIGDTITFGNYNGHTEWIVLDKQKGNLVLISKYAIEKYPYNKAYKETDWNKSSLRDWLNSIYINATFSKNEQEAIANEYVDYSENTQYGTMGSGITDKVYILSLEEVNQYFKSDQERKVTLIDGTETNWWLRSPGCDKSNASYVRTDGSVDYAGFGVDNMDQAVRPVIRVSENYIIQLNGQRNMSNQDKILTAEVGDFVTFGNYNGNTEWIVIDKKEDKLLLLSKYAIDERKFDEYSDPRWEMCSVRNWLNSEYINLSFGTEEQKKIVPARLENKMNPYCGKTSGGDTTDRVFLLSIEEVFKYFDNDNDRKAIFPDGTQVNWWLRTAGYSSGTACVVKQDGTVCDNKEGIKEFGKAAIRPALWISVSNTGETVVDKPVEENMIEDLSTKEIGDTVLFGKYKGNREWIVLEKKDGKLLLLSKNVIDRRPFYSRFGSSWENSELREWLNSTYLEYTFSEEEKSKIITTLNSNLEDLMQGTKAADTEDKIFVLSVDEVKQYMMNGETTDYLAEEDWWTRTPVKSNFYTYISCVDVFGFIEDTCYQSNSLAYVRPAMWISVN